MTTVRAPFDFAERYAAAFDVLEDFEARTSDDIVKTDLELTCVACGEVLCDVEHGDSLAVLASVAAAHHCLEVPQ